MNKKFTSLLLVLAMLMSMMVVPAYAEGAPSMTLTALSFTEAEANPTEGAAIDTVKPGDTFMLKVQFNAAEAIEMGSYSVKLAYDSAAFEVYSYVDAQENKVGPVAGTFWEPTVNTNKEDVALWLSASTDYESVAADESVVLGYLLLQVKADAENADYDFSFIVDGEGENNKNYVSDSKAVRVNGVDLSSAAHVTVTGGKAPELGSVSLEAKEVTVDAKTPQSVQALAYSAKGTPVANKVTWSVTPADQGVSIDTVGAITVNAKAVAGDYTVTATPMGEGICTGEVKTATLTVNRAPAELKSFAIDGEGSVAVAQDLTNVVKNYAVADGLDQFDSAYDLKAVDVIWSVTKADGVSIGEKDGVLTVEPKAAAGTVTITAKIGEVTATKDVTITKAAAVPDTMVILKGIGEDANELDDTDTVNIPAEGKEDNVYTYTAQVLDQYGAEFKGKVDWTCSGATGVTFSSDSETATLTVKHFELGEGEEITLTLTATCKDEESEKTVSRTVTIKVVDFMPPVMDEDDPEYENVTGASIKESVPNGDGTASIKLEIPEPPQDGLTYLVWVVKKDGGELAGAGKVGATYTVPQDSKLQVYVKGDLATDGKVDLADVLRILIKANSYGRPGVGQPSGLEMELHNFDGAGEVDLADVLALLIFCNSID